MFILYNTEEDRFETFNLEELLEMINRDRSGEWSEYNSHSTLKEIIEAVEFFCDPYIVSDDMPFRSEGR